MSLDEITVLEVDGIDFNDYPDFCDAYISKAEYKGIELTTDEIEWLNTNRAYVYEAIINYIH